MNDTASFLLKVFLVSAGISLLIEVGGPGLSTQSLDTQQLNQVAIATILTPSLIIGTFLGLKFLLDRPAA